MEVSKILNEEYRPGPQYGTIESLMEAQEEQRRGLQHKPHSVLQEQEQPSVKSADTGSRRPAYEKGGRVYEALELRHDVADDVAAEGITPCTHHFIFHVFKCSVNFT